RRVASRRARPDPQPERGAGGRLSGIGARGRDARQIPEKLQEAGAVFARRAGRREIRDAGLLPHFPCRPPDHGPGAEHLVPAGGPQPADLCGYLQREGIGLPEGDAARVPIERGGVARKHTRPAPMMETAMPTKGNRRMTRRALLQAGTGMALGGWVEPGNAAGAKRQAAESSVYQALGVKHVINATGTVTVLGGSLIPPEV